MRSREEKMTSHSLRMRWGGWAFFYPQSFDRIFPAKLKKSSKIRQNIPLTQDTGIVCDRTFALRVSATQALTRYRCLQRQAGT